MSFTLSSIHGVSYTIIYQQNVFIFTLYLLLQQYLHSTPFTSHKIAINYLFSHSKILMLCFLIISRKIQSFLTYFVIFVIIVLCIHLNDSCLNHQQSVQYSNGRFHSHFFSYSLRLILSKLRTFSTHLRNLLL